MKVVLVESPTKIKSIGKFLGPGYQILSTFGHVRDLPSKQGSVDPQEKFHMTWQVTEKGEKALRAIKTALKKADTLIVATDPDREGEAIAWHVLEYLKEAKALDTKTVQRVSFNAITKSSVTEALKSPRPLNQELVDAYLARLSLDYLVGFTLSPVLWRKLPGSRSAGRVQSVALRLVVERESDIETFISQEYWSIEALFQGKEGSFQAQLRSLRGQKIEKLTIGTERLAQEAVSEAKRHHYHIQSVEKKRTKRNPPPPFITSTLQQEASRKLGLSPSRTMMLAQKLYEGIDIDGESVGLITYMRTDSVQVVPEAIQTTRRYIQNTWEKAYLPEKPRVYKTKAKNAQEAHEAIRPTDPSRHPQSLSHLLDTQTLALYALIWKRMVASQMSVAEFDQVGVDVASDNKEVIFRATGSTLAFDGFLKLYQESSDEPEEKTESKLPPLQEGEPAQLQNVESHQHFTQPPSRYSEASLVKKMEELGIGRPSTYARVLQVLKDRNYVRLEKKNVIPEERGHLVTAFLRHFFNRYVAYDFTANLENQLDEISGGKLIWKSVLQDFWDQFNDTIKESSTLKIADVLETLEKDLAFHLFGQKERTCPDCKEGELGLRLGKFGAFLGCSDYPTCKYTRPLDGTPASKEVPEQGDSPFPKNLGTVPGTDQVISIRLGPYGLYLQWGEGPKPKRVPLPKGINLDTLDLEKALVWGQLPRELGTHPETQLKIVAGLGRFGPYFKHGDKFVSVKDIELVLSGTLEQAVEAIHTKEKQSSSKRPPRTPTTKKAVKRSKASS